MGVRNMGVSITTSPSITAHVPRSLVVVSQNKSKRSTVPFSVYVRKTSPRSASHSARASPSLASYLVSCFMYQCMFDRVQICTARSPSSPPYRTATERHAESALHARLVISAPTSPRGSVNSPLRNPFRS